uniref:ADP-ribosylation factor-binding protein GGA3-like n=1 Tax=Mastacembelus armatus TaxID=205130 RepID=A0A7N8XZH2_9TELE
MPQVALRLLAHKIQSPQEKEALQALTVLEACMNNCGKRFHSEATKFRFLNELIKILTPKYFGAWTPQKVKDRVTEVLYGWTLWLKEEPKIQEAYSMLKKQGIVKKDPKLPETLIMAPPPQRTTDSIFDQEDKDKLLARLLKSARPEDLEMANRIIKNTIKEEQEKEEKVLKRESTLKEVESSTKQLRELLGQNTALYERCDRLRPTLFRLASDTMDDDVALAQILAANDELTVAVNAYKEQVGRMQCNGRRERSRSEEDALGKNNGRPHFGHFFFSLFVYQILTFALALICSSVAQKQPNEMFGDTLRSIFVPMETIKSSQLEPIVLHDQCGIHVSLHFAKDSAPGHPGVAVVVISTVNTSALEVKDFLFQAAVPKTMLVKLQPASGTHLPPYNPLLAPPAISQVLLLTNPQKCKVRVRYKLTLTHGDQQLNKTGDINSFPDWTALVGH